MRFGGIEIVIERPNLGYGFIPGISSVDAGDLDVFVGNDETSKRVYIFYRRKRRKGGFLTEPKIVVGCRSKEEAERMFRKRYGKDKIVKSRNLNLVEFKKELRTRDWRNSK